MVGLKFGGLRLVGLSQGKVIVRRVVLLVGVVVVLI